MAGAGRTFSITSTCQMAPGAFPALWHLGERPSEIYHSTLNLLHTTDQNVTDERRILFAPLRNPAWKHRGLSPIERTEETNCVAPTRVFRIRSNCKRHGSNDLRRGQNREQKQKSKIPERQTNFDTRSSIPDDQKTPRAASLVRPQSPLKTGSAAIRSPGRARATFRPVSRAASCRR